MTPDETYWDYCARGELRLQHCAVCGTWLFPPGLRCNNCLSTELRWEPVSGDAVVWSWLRMHRKYFSDPAFAPPYLVTMVQLAEGPRMISSIQAPTRDPRVGEKLRLVFDDGQDANGHRLPFFAFAEAS